MSARSRDALPGSNRALAAQRRCLYELLAYTPEQYLDKACSLANDPERLANLRAGMRGRMSASPLMDSVRFTRNLEDAYRSMWRQWCKERM
jgi:protein O-GlcNAc transferase